MTSNIPSAIADIPGLDTSDPAVQALLQRFAALEEKAQRSPRQRKSFGEMWNKRVNTPLDKMPLGYKCVIEWLIDEGMINESQSGLVYAACWSYQCAEGKEVRHNGGASREALKEAREALENAAYVRMTTEEDDSDEEVTADSEDEDIDLDEDIDDEDTLDDDDSDEDDE